MAASENETYLAYIHEHGLTDTFCPVPFCTLILNPDGKVGVCREKGSDHSVGDINRQSLEEIWNSESLKAWRQEFLEGRVKTCAKEQAHKSCHRFRPNRELIPRVRLDSVQELKAITRLSPDFNGKCNLGCGICDIRLKPNGLYDKLNLWPGLERDVFPNLLELDLLSGEPFIQKDLYRLMRTVSAVNPHCRWRFTTNGHWNLNATIRSHLDRIHIRYISVSVDSLDSERYARLRKGNLHRVLKTVRQLMDYREERRARGAEDFQLLLNCTIHRENWDELGSLIEYPRKLGLLPAPQLLYRPENFSILTLPEMERMRILRLLLSTLSKEQLPFAHWIIRALADTLPEAIGRKALQGFRTFLELHETPKGLH